MKRWILLLFCLCFLAGCWDGREINELAFVSSAAIDKDGDRWHVTVELFEPGGMQERRAIRQRAARLACGSSWRIYFQRH